MQKANVRNEEDRVKMEKERNNERVRSLESQLERCMEETVPFSRYTHTHTYKHTHTSHTNTRDEKGGEALRVASGAVKGAMMLVFHTAAAPYKRAGKGLPEARYRH